MAGKFQTLKLHPVAIDTNETVEAAARQQ